MTYLSWGRYPRHYATRIHRVFWRDQIDTVLKNASERPVLPYGMGRSYGDSCLNDGGELIDCTRCDRILAADWESGIATIEAGMTLAELLKIIVPRGWFLPVTPGTKYVTIGGAVANDVHGKNHHRSGTFGCFVRSLQLHRSDALPLICNTERNPGLFRATIGGIGLTGVIGAVELQLKKIAGSLIDTEVIPFDDLGQFLEVSDSSDSDYEYTVAWIDCFSETGRGIFFRGNHSPSPDSRKHEFAEKLQFPFTAPEWLLGKTGVQLFNSAYYRLQRSRSGKSVVSYDSFFYPLDSIGRWNLMYGKRGFLQYQLVVPPGQEDALRMIMRAIAASDSGSFLAVLKKFGNPRSPGMMSFPRPGLTLALDIPFRGEKTLDLLTRLDNVVLEAGGAVYPAKDARMSSTMFKASFPHWEEFSKYVDPRMSSSFWRRVTEQA
jgi:FAD/FMN-containing dehydrogenase